MSLVILPVDAEEVFDGSVEELELVAIDFLKNKEASKAQQLFSLILSRAEDPELLQRTEYNAGIAAYRSGQLDRAVAHWQAVLLRDEGQQQAKSNLEAVQKEIRARKQLKPSTTEPSLSEKEDGEKQGSEQQEAKEDQLDHQPSSELKKEDTLEVEEKEPERADADFSKEKKTLQFTKEEAQRLLNSVREGKIRGVHRGLGSEEKGW